MSTGPVSNPLPSLQTFAPARVVAKTRAVATPNDQFGAERLARSRAQTPLGYHRLANDISRQLIGAPLTQKKQHEIRAQKKRLIPQKIDQNAYRQPTVRKCVPYERRSRRRRGWKRCELVLPTRLLEGLKLLAKTRADEQAAKRLEEPYGYRRRAPRTPSSFAAEAINRLLAETQFSVFCVED
jgi:hypothetical protein